MQPDIALRAFQRDAPVSSIDIHAAVDRLHAHRSITSMNLHVPADGLGIDRPVSGINLEVCVFRHADLNSWTALIVAPRKAPVTGNARVELHAVAFLPGVDVQIFV